MWKFNTLCTCSTWNFTIFRFRLITIFFFQQLPDIILVNNITFFKFYVLIISRFHFLVFSLLPLLVLSRIIISGHLGNLENLIKNSFLSLTNWFGFHLKLIIMIRNKSLMLKLKLKSQIPIKFQTSQITPHRP